MGKIIYEPKKAMPKKETSLSTSNGHKKEATKEKGENIDFVEQRYNALIENIDSVRPIGDTDCDYVVYLEDYVYTYIYQYAGTDLECEHSAIVLGELYPETKELIVCGIIPISKEHLTREDEWVNQEAINSALEEKEKYFKGASILGWMHMQPGYGTMLTMKEVKAHRDLFDREGTLLLLLDPVNKIENFYIYEDDTLKEQSGYYIYYDKNACMQQYMLEHPFVAQEKEQVEDTLVNQFREIGRKRKKEYEQRKRLNFTVAASALALLAMAAVITKMSDQRNEIKGLQNDLAQVSAQATPNTNTGLNTNNTDGTEDVKFTIQADGNRKEAANEEEQDGQIPEEAIDANSNALTVVDQTEDEEVEKNEQAPIAGDDKVEGESKVIAENIAESVKDEEGENKEKQSEETNQVETNLQDTTDYINYVVQEGDTLLKISYDHYQTESRAKEIIKLNSIDNGDHIYVGQKIKIPVE